MLKVAFIGKRNQTNDIIAEILRSAFGAVVDFIAPENILARKDADIGPENKLVIIDLNTSHGFGSAPANIKSIKKNTDRVPLLVLDHHDDKKFIQPLIDAGASGIISHTPDEVKLIEVITELQNGNTFYDYPDH